MVGLEGTVRDVVHAMRLAIKRPGFSAAVVLTLAVGIGGNTAVFNLVDTVVLSRLQYEDSENLYSVFERDAAGGRRLPSYPTFEDWEDRSQVFDGLAFARGAPLTYRTDDQAGLLLGAFVSEAFFGTLGVPAVLGRALLQDDYLPDAEAATVLSYRAWTSWFGADPQIIGTTIVLEDRPFTVVGVMSNDFAFPDWGADNDLWMPIVRLPPADYAALMQRGFHADSRVVARLAGDVTPARAQAEIGALAQALADNYPETNGGWTRVSFEPLREFEVGNVATRLGAQRVVHGSGVQYELTLRNEEFEAVGHVRWLGREEPLTQEEFEEEREAYRAMLMGFASGRSDFVNPIIDAQFAPELAPDVRPALGPVFMDDLGQIWVSRFEPRRLGSGWHVLDPEGRPIARVSIPEESKLVAVRSDRVALMVRNDLDVEELFVRTIIH